MFIEDVAQEISTLAEKICRQMGMELIESKVSGNNNDVRIQITADKPSGGINARECGIINRSLAAAIEQENLLSPEIFSLEVSSPGLDRPLVSRKDFSRLIGRNIRFWLREPVVQGGKKEVEGVLHEVGEATLTIDAPGVPDLVLPLPSVIKGMLVI